MSTGDNLGLKTLEDTGEAPETRMADASAAQDFVGRLMQGDSKAGKKRALVDGLIDGNPPYSWRKLRDAGRADACNVNWGTARTYLESGNGAFYDLFSQAPGYCTVSTSFGENQDARLEYGRIMSEIANELIDESEDFDNDIQLSQNEMVLHGTGPLFWETPFKVFPMSIESGDLLLPNKSPTKVSRWEVATVLWDYYPPELYEFIEDEAAAKTAGWDVEYVKNVIRNAVDISQSEGSERSWEWYQNQMKSNSLTYYDDSKVCKVAHLFYKEFGGRVSHVIVERQTTASNNVGKQGNGAEAVPGTKYLYTDIGRGDSMGNYVNPMYFDRGRGGKHHRVTGLGVKLYSPMEYENRLLSNLMDKTFAPKILLKPGSAEAKEKFQIAKFGDWGLVPPGTEGIQAPLNGYINDGLAIFHTSGELMRSNLSQYRQAPAPEKPGNPATAFQKKIEVSQQSALSNTTFSRYYKQLDNLYQEIIRRMCNLNTNDPIAKEFQERCMARGVPREAFGRILRVKAVRAVGQGSPFMRQEVTTELMQVIGGCSEDGQMNWRDDFIASRAGQDAVARYNPRPSPGKLPSDQRERAMNQVVGMKIGLAPTITASQNPATFAGVFLEAAATAVGTLQQGANPQEILSFIDLAAPAAQAHIKRMEQDPLKKEIIKMLEERIARIAQVADKIRKMVQQKQEQEKQQQQKAAAGASEEQLKQQKVQADIQRKNAKTQHDMQLKEASTKQQLAISDAQTAADIRTKAAKTNAEIDTKHKKTDAEIENARLKAEADAEADRTAGAKVSGE